MYTGLKFLGLIGLLVGPIVLIILSNVFEKFLENGIFKVIFNKR